MKLDLSPGTSIDEAITAMLKVAPVCRETITARFNGIELSACVNTTRADLERQWETGTAEASARYWASPDATENITRMVVDSMERLSREQKLEVVRRVQRKIGS